ncbi:MAG: ribosome biogenesis GTPase Der [Candidatus Nomurabacteria bacterium]|jgi:GTP-binding protein|nr:ribosome biogenesis GTPase Der [Candidatus Nomurabacteria bacterium]
MTKLPTVAIVGRANAGKSSLFNRLVGQRQAIVAREAGTTRDNVIGTVDDRFQLVDTAGLKDPADDFEATIQDQVADAIDAADAILFVVDSTEYPLQTDGELAHKILKSKKPVILCLNKADLKEHLGPEEFLKFGIKDVIETSAEHSRGIRETIKKLGAVLPPAPKKTMKVASDDTLKIALIGRPNAGKSKLFNALAGKQQAVVAARAGTTRDINRAHFKYDGRDIELLDTAGVRRSGKIERGIEKFSILRTMQAIEESDICLLLMDVGEVNTGLDQKLAGIITDAGKGIIIVVSKWDTLDDKDAFTRDQLAADITHKFEHVPYAPLIFTSSETGQNVTKLFELTAEIAARRRAQIPTRELNVLLQKAVHAHPPAGLKNTHPKFRYMVQTDINPAWFVVYGSHFKFIHWSYKRYLERQMREAFDFTGTPIKFSFRDEKQIKANKENSQN